ncbi:MAG TPA: pitrilysin family protein [Pyrinomonadaceae bacterium]|nr:pitrilysin family protein [Pyrinomonadaceae bacterium]
MINRRRVLSAMALMLTISLSPVILGQKKSSASDSIKLPFETYKLPNGLTVIFSEDHTTPTVAVDVWYHVGSKNEISGRTGFAHLFEHVMFTGSGHVPYGLHDKLTEGVGGGNNGSTTNDRTNYYETIPSNYLESALWLESDRMGFLLDTLGLEKLNAQRDVVKNERRQSYDNQPYGRVSEIFSAAMYPKGHPYSWPVIGSMTDLSAASEEDVKAFFRVYYAPNNATLAVVGDFDPKQAKAWIQKYFGDLPQGKAVQRPNVPLGKLTDSKRLVYEDRVQVPRLYIQWPTVGFKQDDEYPLGTMSLILSGSRTARLTKALVYDQQLASQVFAFNNSSEDVGVFQVTIVPRPEHTLTELEAAVDQVIQKFIAEGPTAEELQRAKAGFELNFLRGLESNLGKANQLIAGSVFYGNAGQFRTDAEKSMAVTAADVKRVANQYLSRSRIVLSVVPKGKRDQASKAAESEAVSVVIGNGGGK